jgi:hypothetical protein
MVVWEGVTAGEMRSRRVGEISGQFLVTQTM